MHLHGLHQLHHSNTMTPNPRLDPAMSYNCSRRQILQLAGELTCAINWQRH
ncbi:BQ5605_C034g11310 [Microbotryum silenes-dioicae]|uniref:BQ5605_C034g11310 protein n=1 Tax=Microbotryum silenes-dioicae TaxID=796604 RepID=A0A2X0MJC4_9BASI|nr:BQ5605_C034g11310 [Microbotryum silenes-dioicae]